MLVLKYVFYLTYLFIFFLFCIITFGHMPFPTRILSVSADIETIGEILLKIIPTLEEVSAPWPPEIYTYRFIFFLILKVKS